MAVDKGAQQWDDKEDEEEAPRRRWRVEWAAIRISRIIISELRKGVLARASWIDSPNPMLVYCHATKKSKDREILLFLKTDNFG